ncbi:hypothetical protein QZH41_016034 [Actinostola sp. cb2023]|nr:hypothetical protein QZH41_016034 [Actinostola sp. cb2023]
MFYGLLRAPSYFFDTNSIGRILNRFSKDMGFIDDIMPFIVCDFTQTFIMVLGILCLVAVNNPITFAIVVPVVIMFWYLRSFYMKTSREVKRIEGISRSPLFGHVSTTLLGLDTIRAFGVEQTFTNQMNYYQDEHTRAWMTFISSSAWLSFRLDLLCVAFICFVVLVSPALKGALSAGVVGLTLSYAIMISGVLQQCVRQSTEVENMMTSVERILEYTDLEPEALPETDVKPRKGWPDKGRITFDNMSFSYHKTLPNVLHNVSFQIKSMEKKDKRKDITTFRHRPMSLSTLKGIEPVIFSGTMRKNIDPFNEYSDAELWKVLEEVQLKSAVEGLPDKLEFEIAEGGSNFSVGQRQLVCLARAILRHSKVLVIDEATANVDPRTDALIQTTIRDKFKECTVLTIAHRLHTIMDSDRVIVTISESRILKTKEIGGKASWVCQKYALSWSLAKSRLYHSIPLLRYTKSLCLMCCSEWDKELSKTEGTKKKPSLLKAIVRTFGFRYSLLGFFAIITDALKIIQPLFLGWLVNYFAIGSTVTQTQAFLAALGVAICAILNSFLMTPFTFMRQLFGMRLRIACTSLIYNKVLRLSNSAIAKATTGFIVNLISTDTQKFDWASYFLHYIILGPIEAIIVLYLLWREVGVASFVGMGILLLLVPMQMKMGAILMNLRRRAAQWVDQRVKIMNEIISGISVIKMYTWELPFADRLEYIRRNELKWFLKLASIRGVFMAFFFSSAALVSYATFLTYVLTDNKLTAQKVFTCIALFNAIRINMTLFFPIGITLMNEGRVSIQRIEELLNLDELHSHGLITTKLRPKPENCGIVAENVVGSWNEEILKPTLNDISFEIAQGQLLAVVGAVGAGKSSLLMSILGELPLSKGTIAVKGKIAYSSQQAWIYNGSLRNNIVFGNDFDESRYNEVITACALERDIELLSDGDMTLVGERGVSLSGGQKARVNLARAVYSDADIFLLDDPLSAVDANVGRHLFDKCICGYLASKPRVLVTHQTQFLKDADILLALSEGECIAKGTYQDLCHAGVDFMTLCADPEEEDRDSAIEDNDVDVETARPEFKREFSRRLNLTRQFSRQDSIPASEKVEVVRGSSCHLNHRLSQRLESTLSVASQAAAEVSVYDEDLVPKETKQEGAVTLQTYKRYLQSLHSAGAASFVFFLFIITQVVFMLADWWLSEWCNEEEQHDIKTQQYKNANHSVNSTTIAPPVPLDRNLYLGVYSVLAIGLLILTTLRTQLFYRITIAGSRILHSKMFYGLLRAPSYFFDTNSIGRILNRFSKDMGFIDDMMPFIVCDFTQTFLMVLGIMCLVAVNNPVTFAIVVPVVIMFWYLRSYYMKTSREVKRIEGITLSAGVVGLTLSYAIMISGVFQQCVRQSAEVENMMTSVERILEYTDLEPEALPETDVKPRKGWPDKGRITFENMSFSYHKTLPNVLHNVSFQIKSMEKEPVIFSGTMRKNIDPFNEYSDVELWKVLEEVQLKSAVEGLPDKLEFEIAEGGSNFSVGQRQLVCLARAILRHSKVLVIDEATANVDPRTDALIQTTIRDKFKECTVLTIAHRLHTIMDSDRVIVLDAGHIKEFDAPYILLKNARTIFSQLVTQTGAEEARKLYEIAREAYYEQRSLPEDKESENPFEVTDTDGIPEVEVINPADNGEAAKLLQFETNL